MKRDTSIGQHIGRLLICGGCAEEIREDHVLLDCWPDSENKRTLRLCLDCALAVGGTAWKRLTGEYPKTVADILAELDAKEVATHALPDGTVGVVAVGKPAPAPVAEPQRGGRSGWRRLSAPGDKCGARWLHEASGWEVKHCGHPTANWPYHAADPEHPGRVVVTHNGKGFRRLVEAMQAVEGVLTGAIVATNERCGAATRRVLTRDELRAEARRD